MIPALSLFFCLAAQQSPGRLSETPEWQAMVAELAKHSRYELSFRCTSFAKFGFIPDRDSSGVLAVLGNRSFAVATSHFHSIWDGKQATSLNPLTNKLSTSKTKPRLGTMEVFGAGLLVGSHEDGERHEDAWTRISREVVDRRFGPDGKVLSATRKTLTGWHFSDVWGDTSRWVEILFDPETHLLVEASEGAGGMQPAFHCDYSIWWDIEPKNLKYMETLSPREVKPPEPRKPLEFIAVEFSPKLPRGCGKLVVRTPKGSSCSLSLIWPGSMSISGSSGATPFEVVLPETVFRLEIAGQPMPGVVRERTEKTYTLGALRSRRKEPVRLMDGKTLISERRPGARPVAVCPGVYEAVFGNVRRRVEVLPGKILEIR